MSSENSKKGAPKLSYCPPDWDEFWNQGEEEKVVEDEVGASNAGDLEEEEGPDEASGENLGEMHQEQDDDPVISGMAMDMEDIVSHPIADDVFFELTCSGRCWADSGPWTISCAHGHVICTNCYHKSDTKTCKTEINDSSCETRVCGAKFYGIDKAIKNTPYYKIFMEAARYECGGKKFGCDVVLSGNEIEKHEKQECPFRFLKYCGFREKGCPSTFQNIEENLEHAITKHNLPVVPGSGARLMLRYGRKEFLKDNEFTGVIPMMRAVVTGRQDNLPLCILMGQDLEDNKTRLWLVKAVCKDGDDDKLTAFVRISRIVRTNEHNNGEAKPNSMAVRLTVVPEWKEMLKVELVDGGDDPYYVDLRNEEMNEKYGVEKGGEWYLQVLILIGGSDNKNIVEGHVTGNETEEDDEDDD